MDTITYDTIHGELLSVCNIGVLLIGKSGIGKSETAVELIFRGHRLISDDAVDLITRDGKVFGRAPTEIRNLIEIRGVGILDIKKLFGDGSVVEEAEIGLVIELEKWDDNKNYARLKSYDETVSILGVDVPKLLIPVDAGRNLAIVIEVAVRNFAIKKGNIE